MAQYIIPATFADDTGFVSGLSPNITIREWDELNSIYVEVINDTMSDMGLGDYMYVFENYDKYKLYIYKIDGMVDTVTNRYFSGTNELDYYSNKQDWGQQIRGAYVNMDKKIIESVLEELSPKIDKLHTKEVDFSNIINILDEINNKDVIVSDNSEILNRIDDIKIIDNTSTIIGEIQKKDKKYIILNKQLEQSNETISILKDYIEKLMLRGDIKNDPDFRRMIRKAKKKEIEIQNKLLEDEDFISLLSGGLLDT